MEVVQGKNGRRMFPCARIKFFNKSDTEKLFDGTPLLQASKVYIDSDLAAHNKGKLMVQPNKRFPDVCVLENKN